MALNVEPASPFARTEIPERLVMRFRKPNGTDPVDLTSYDAFVEHTLPNGTAVEKSADVLDGTEGKVGYDFAEGDLDSSGNHKFQFRVESGSDPVVTRLFSSVVEVSVFDTPADDAGGV